MKKWIKWFGLVVAAVVIFALGRASVGFWGSPTGDPHHRHGAAGAGADAAAGETGAAGPTLYTCPMHPQIKLPDPGTCPICGMDLVPMTEGKDEGPRRLAMSPAAVQLANIETAPVRREFLSLPVRLVGKVEFDETRVRTIAARVAGRLDRLYVDYTGITVQKNDHLVWLYSPELLTAQQELIGARQRLQATAGEASEFLAASNRRGYESARDKLLLWGLTEEQVEEIESRGKAEDHMLIRSPAAGVVIDKRLDEGGYVKVGTPIYRIADLSHLWIKLDAYEQDLPWLRYGQGVSINTEAFPGEVFQGRISFLDPTVDERTRTVRVRVNVENADGKLKPGMFVRAIVKARIGDGGHVLEPHLAGKWISPMHPEIVKDGPGQCDICGMDLVPAESLGYVGRDAAQRPLVVPASAVLVTGTRGVVYVEVPDTKRPTYEGREVVLGPRAGDDYIIRAGLAEHERVVVNGAFRVDSAMQIRAKPSMMSMPGDASSFTGPDTAVFRASLDPVYDAYLEIQRALAADDVAAARAAAGRLRDRAGSVVVAGLPAAARERWHEEAATITSTAKAAGEATSIASVREQFRDLARAVLSLERTFRHATGAVRFEVFCPMAFGNQGASWMQATEEVANPFFGASMLKCGEVRAKLPGVPQQARPAGDDDAGKGADKGAGKGAEKAKDSDKAEDAEKAEDADKAKDSDKVSMPGDASSFTGPDTAVFRASLDPVYDAYLEIQRALAADDVAAARAAAGRLRDRAGSVVVAGLPAAARERWHEEAATITTAAKAAGEATSIAAVRAQFRDLARAVLSLERTFRHATGAVRFEVFCPMAFGNQGASWMQATEEVANPFFGAAMLKCGEVRAKLPGVPQQTPPAGDDDAGKGADKGAGKGADKGAGKGAGKVKDPDKAEDPDKAKDPDEAKAEQAPGGKGR